MPEPDASQTSRAASAIRLRYKILAYVVAWVGALFATDPSGGLWALAWMFPLGLPAFVNRRWGNDGGWWVLAACYAVYVVHGYSYFRSKRLFSTVLLYALLIGLLVCNVGGCGRMVHGH
jgi:hypothetical protein